MTRKKLEYAAAMLVLCTFTFLVYFSIFAFYRVAFAGAWSADAVAECDTLGGTLIVSADDRYICVADAVEVGK